MMRWQISTLIATLTPEQSQTPNKLNPTAQGVAHEMLKNKYQTSSKNYKTGKTSNKNHFRSYSSNICDFEECKPLLGLETQKGKSRGDQVAGELMTPPQMHTPIPRKKSGATPAAVPPAVEEPAVEEPAVEEPAVEEPAVVEPKLRRSARSTPRKK
jgi:hypothetical protein